MSGLPVIGHALALVGAGAALAEGAFFCFFAQEVDQRRARQNAAKGLAYPRAGHVHPRTLGMMMLGIGAMMLASNFAFFL